MTDDDSKTLLLLNLLQDSESESARKKYLALLNIGKIDDQKVYERIEDLVVNATLMKDSAVEIRTDLAQQMLIMLKGGLKRPRGGQQITRYQKLRLRTLVGLGRRIKEELIQEGLTATEAHLEAAERAAKEAKAHDIDYEAGYLAREMDNAER